MNAKRQSLPQTDPPSLVAIAVGANRAGNRKLEQAARRELETTHGIAIRFLPKRRGSVKR